MNYAAFRVVGERNARVALQLGPKRYAVACSRCRFGVCEYRDRESAWLALWAMHTRQCMNGCGT